MKIDRVRLRGRDAIADCTFLVGVSLTTAILWIGRLGFYSDDWSFLKIFRFAPDQSIPGLSAAAFAQMPGARMRPMQLLSMAASYKLWGLRPLGYHLVNVVVLSAIGILLWIVLRELGLPRAWALASAVAYLTLPNYSTSRFWFAAYQSTLSIALYLSSLYADLRSVRADESIVWKWRALGVASLIGCVLSYEVALPLFAINIGLTLLLGRTAASESFRRARVTAVLEAAALIGVILFKVLMQTRGEGIHGGYVRHVAGVAKNALNMHWRGYGFGLPLRTWNAVHRYPDARILAMGVAIGLAVAAYLWWASERPSAAWPTLRAGLIWLSAGVLVFALGHAIFLITDVGARGGFTMTGKNNRVAVAATLGVALIFVAGAGCLVRFFPPAMRGAAFASLIGLLAACGFIIDNTVANFWARAYRKQMDVLAKIQIRFPRLPPHGTLVLDGVCPYVGPANVFRSKWDLAGLLALTYRDPEIRADVVSNQLVVREDGLLTRSLAEGQNFYPYSSSLIVFDPRSNSITPLPDAATARRYFQQRPELPCPRGENL